MIGHHEFMAAWHGFREIMCSTVVAPEEKLVAWGELLEAYRLCEADTQATYDGYVYSQKENREAAMDLLMVEFPELEARNEK